MINTTLLWMFLIPLIFAGATLFLVPKWSPTGRGYGYQDAAIFAVVGFLISAGILAGSFYLGKGSKTADTEIWNGEVTGKTREHGTYEQPYDCNCRQVQSCSGSGKDRSCTSSTVCDTCYETHYTVKWDCNSNIGSFRIDSADRTSRSVYQLPDPIRYAIIKQGDPVSKSHSYTNYIKAVPETLFRPATASLKAQFAGQLPAYPGNIYDFYHVDRIVPVGVSIPDYKEWNTGLAEMLKKLGPAKQANAVVVITKSADPNYFYALQDEWLNGKKNDVVLVIGAPEFPKKAAWVNVMALTQNNIFQVKLRDDILALEDLTKDGVLGAMQKNISESFLRKRMRDFEYLDGEIDPPEWMMWTSVGIICAGWMIMLFVIYNQTGKLFKRQYR